MVNLVRISTGKEGENFATLYLAELGHTIIRQNFREKFGELDIVSKDRDGLLVFTEVKTMHPGDIKPEDQMSQSKLVKFKKIAQFFANSHPELIDEKKGWRIDLLALTKIEKSFEIKHYENIA